MAWLVSVLLAVGGILILFGGLVGVSILQKGKSRSGQTLGEILGKDPGQAQVQDVRKLTKADFFALFKAAPAAGMEDLNGEYQAENHRSGVMAGLVELYTSRFFGPGRWIGKSFASLDETHGEGVNVFEAQDPAGKPIKKKARRMDTFVGRSSYDNKDSFHLDYSRHNAFLARSIRDELRKINSSLYVGLGRMPIGGGARNPSPFVLYDANALLAASNRPNESTANTDQR